MKGKTTNIRMRLEIPETRKSAIKEIVKTAERAGSVENTAALLGISTRTLANLLAVDADLRAAWDQLDRPTQTRGWRR